VKRAMAVALLVLAGCGTAQPPEPAPASTTQDPITAICEDGAVSYATNRRGACSGHGGVAQWLGDAPDQTESG